MNTMEFSLITPEAVYFSGQASMVEAPGIMGDFGVLPGHMNFISTLRPGVVTIHDADARITRIFVAGGVAEVNNASCSVLAEQVVDVNSISRADAEARIAQAQKKLEKAFEEKDIILITKELEVAEALLQAMA